MRPLTDHIGVRRDKSRPSLFEQREPPTLRYVGTVACRLGETFHHPLHNDAAETEIELVLEGDQYLLIDGREYHASAGDLFVFNQGIWHEEKTLPEKPFRAVYVNFTGLRMNGLPPGYFIDRAQCPVFPMGERAFGIEQRFIEAGRALAAHGGENITIADALLQVLLSEIAEIVHGRGSDDNERSDAGSRIFVAAQRHIHSYYGQPLTLAEIGAAANASESHLCRVFREASGYSPIDYLARYRVEVAKEILRSSDDTVAAVAERVGYQSETHFQNVFRRIAGVPPGRYRRMALGGGMPRP